MEIARCLCDTRPARSLCSTGTQPVVHLIRSCSADQVLHATAAIAGYFGNALIVVSMVGARRWASSKETERAKRRENPRESRYWRKFSIRHRNGDLFDLPVKVFSGNACERLDPESCIQALNFQGAYESYLPNALVFRKRTHFIRALHLNVAFKC